MENWNQSIGYISQRILHEKSTWPSSVTWVVVYTGEETVRAVALAFKNVVLIPFIIYLYETFVHQFL